MIVQRSTKIVATLGPASSEEAVLRRMVLAGVDIVRLNFSHGTAEDHAARVRLLRAITKDTGRTVGIMADLQGPKIRVGKFEHGKVELVAGAPFILDVACKLGNAERVKAAIESHHLADNLAGVRTQPRRFRASEPRRRETLRTPTPEVVDARVTTGPSHALS